MRGGAQHLRVALFSALLMLVVLVRKPTIRFAPLEDPVRHRLCHTCVFDEFDRESEDFSFKVDHRANVFDGLLLAPPGSCSQICAFSFGITE